MYARTRRTRRRSRSGAAQRATRSSSWAARKPLDRGDTGPHGAARRGCGPWTRPAPATRSTAASSSPWLGGRRRASACDSATSSARSRRSPPAGSSACRGAASSHERRSAVKIAVIGGAGVRTPLLVGGLTALRSADRRDRALRRRPAAPGGHRRPGASGWPRGARVTRADRSPSASTAPTSCSPASASAAPSSACATRRRRSATGSSARRRSGRPASRWRCAPSRRWSTTRARSRALAPRRVDRQLHQPGQHGHRRRCARRATRVDRHLRHADRDVRGRRARARPAVGPLPLRLLRPEPSRLASRGLCDGEPQLHRLWRRSTRLRSRLPARRCSSRGCASCGCCRPSTSTTTTSRERALRQRPPRRAEPRRRSIAALTDALFDDLADAGRRPGRASTRRISPTRSASYMQIETGSDAPTRSRAVGRSSPATTGSRSTSSARSHFNTNADHPAQRRQPRQHPVLATTTSSRCRAW